MSVLLRKEWSAGYGVSISKRDDYDYQLIDQDQDQITSPFSYFFPMGHGPYNGDKSPWVMGHTTLYNGTNAPWVMGCATVLRVHGSWVVQWY